MCEIKQFPETNKMSNEESAIKESQENGSKTYQIELTCAELELIVDILKSLDPFLSRLEGFRNEHRFLYERGLEKIYTTDLAEKIFKQFYDADGEYR